MPEKIVQFNIMLNLSINISFVDNGVGIVSNNQANYITHLFNEFHFNRL